jgi:methyltransferase (TIGR00027 family)
MVISRAMSVFNESSIVRRVVIMKEGRASVSAMGSAVLRFDHVREDAPPWALEDTESIKLLSKMEAEAIQRSMAEWPPLVRAGFRLTHAVRARVAEDAALDGLAKERTDYVILGAGLDSFAVRAPVAANLRVWEVDHPDTQAWKRRAMKRSGLPEPSNVTYISSDLSVEHLSDLGLPGLATWNWLGVTMYLEKTATVDVLREIASRDKGTVLVVNFLLARTERTDLGNRVQTAAGKLLKKVGEPVVATYSRSEVELLLADSGFSSIEILEAGDLTERYLKGRSDLMLPSSTIIAVAIV